MEHNFNEKQEEFYARANKKLLVWQSPKYIEAKSKAIEIIDSEKYGLKDGDFWILMNATKSGKMAYTGLIISHNGCLKINDKSSQKFMPESVRCENNGYNNSLVFYYCNAEQGIYEVGEVSEKNCKNEYPYAMAFKRLFDRVVLKLTKLSYCGIMSDSESDEFVQQLDDVRTGFMTKARIAKIRKYCAEFKTNTKKICDKYGIEKVEELNKEQYEECCSEFTNLKVNK